MKHENEYKVRNIYADIKSRSRDEKRDHPNVIKVRVPGSKSITNRNLLLAALSDGECVIKNVLFSDDSRHFINCLKELGFKTEINEQKKCIKIMGCGGNIPKEQADIYVGSAGTAARFLTAFLGLSEGRYHMDCSDQMKKRPMEELLNTLKEVGAKIDYDEKEGCFPYTIGLTDEGIKNREVCVNIDVSSQFLSALLISAVKAGKGLISKVKADEELTGETKVDAGSTSVVRADEETTREAKENAGSTNTAKENTGATNSDMMDGVNNSGEPDGARGGIIIEVCGSHGMAYIDMTVKLMEMFGAKVDIMRMNGDPVEDDSPSKDGRLFYKVAPQVLKAGIYETEADLSAAAYFYGAAAILGISVMVYGVHEDSLQGDIGFLHLLEKMGATLSETDEGIVLTGPKDGKLKGIEADMHTCSDQAITMAAVAVFADSPVTIKGIGHIRHQECDRMMAIVSQLEKMGIDCEMGEDHIRVIPGTPKPCVVETFEDHRMAMGFSLVGLRSDGIVISNPGCCAKTFEDYFEVLDDFIDRF